VVADSYYFVLDNRFLPDEDSELKVRLALVILLGEWMRRIGAINNIGERCFLPFDFSDEYIGGIRVQMMGNDEVMCAYMDTREYGGYSVGVTLLFEVTFDESLFVVSSDSYTLGREELLLRVERNIIGILGGCR
jgi:hypothetical protein